MIGGLRTSDKSSIPSQATPRAAITLFPWRFRGIAANLSPSRSNARRRMRGEQPDEPRRPFVPQLSTVRAGTSTMSRRQRALSKTAGLRRLLVLASLAVSADFVRIVSQHYPAIMLH
jgi:hypothetical protein